MLFRSDPRIKSKAYGKVFLESLPDYRTTRELSEVEEMFQRIESKKARR